MANTTQTKSKLERGYELFKEQLKSLLSFLNIFAISTIIFFLCIFIPYATLTGNVADWVKDVYSATEISKNNDINNCVYNVTKITAKAKEKQDTRNEKRFDDFDVIEKRLTDFKTPLIDKIPISASEAILYFPILITIFLLIFSLRLYEVVNTHKYILIDSSREVPLTDAFGVNKYARIPLWNIGFLVFLISIIYCISIFQLIATIYTNQCNLLNILREGISYRQNVYWYYFFYVISLFLFIISIVLIFKFGNKYKTRCKSWR
ncbi:hypothetical protein [Nostoc sphaeroides]|uniref:Uncharacterized protein n=1 Tax=Nostoc sphaeroides CCNUC1 TaxID=2653204 RepID=A0A5P8W4N0_9NOSO|nr:hypothetical protein [Nostoc sphaeroides]QFS47461.1 hypothetical protein GXM_04953 [Nostoc sphaeroides CCNUC1]